MRVNAKTFFRFFLMPILNLILLALFAVGIALACLALAWLVDWVACKLSNTPKLP